MSGDGGHKSTKILRPGAPAGAPSAGEKPTADPVAARKPISAAPPEGRTQPLRPAHLEPDAPAQSSGSGGAASGGADEPSSAVTGWLVVIEGHGAGQVVSLYYGRNFIGRSPEERISLNFGDEKISRRKAAIIVYDHLTHQFHLSNGESENNIYVGDDVLLAPRLLEDGDVITLGATRLMFKPLCTASFNWEDARSAKKEEAAPSGEADV